MPKNVPIPVKPVKTMGGKMTEYEASCVRKGCSVKRIMSTRDLATRAIAGHIMAAHGDSSYC